MKSLVVFSLLLLAISSVTLGCGSSGKSATDIGATAILTVNGGSDQMVLLSVDQRSFDVLGKAFVANDWAGIQELIDEGSVFSVPNYTKVLVVDSAIGSRRVRVLEGASQGLAGWINVEFLKAQ